MFGKKENDRKSITRVQGSSNVTYIAEGCEIKGSFAAIGNARIDGRVEGPLIHVDGDLDIGPTAVIKAAIEAKTVSIAGEVHGNVRAWVLLELGPTARLYGDIHIKELKIDQGARYIGSSTYDESPVTEESPETLKDTPQ